MLTKTKVKSRIRKKTNPLLREIIVEAVKNDAWFEISKLLSSPKKNYSVLNLKEIDLKSSAGDTLVIVGKVLSKGSLTKKVRICALSISEKAKNKLKETKSEFVPLIEEIKKNSKAEGVRIIK